MALSFPRFMVFGHRGQRPTPTENTLEAVDAALAAGADGVELDLRWSGDGTLVAFHDEDLSRLSGRRDLVATLSVAELKDVPLSGGGRVATLDEVLRVAAARRAWLDLELKEPDTAEEAVRLVERHGLSARTVITSFVADWVEPAHEAAFPVGHIVDQADDPLAEVRPRGFELLAPREEALSAPLLQEATAMGVAVVPWTINDPTQALRWRALGAAGVITDRPASVVERLRGSG